MFYCKNILDIDEFSLKRAILIKIDAESIF